MTATNNNNKSVGLLTKAGGSFFVQSTIKQMENGRKNNGLTDG